MRSCYRSAAALAALTLATSALADQLPAPDLRNSDANTDRVILFSTAETHPAGTFYFSDYEIALLQFGYAFTDRLQISLTGVPPMFSNQPYFFDVTAKFNIFRGDYFRAAIQIAGDGLILPISNPSSLYGVRGGLIGQFCLTAGCLTSMSLNAGALLNNQSNTAVPVYLAAGLIVHVTDTLKLLLEPNYAVAVGDGGIVGAAGFLLNYGVRLSGKQFGFDLAFVKPITGDSGFFVLGIPVLTFTYRTDPGPKGT